MTSPRLAIIGILIVLLICTIALCVSFCSRQSDTNICVDLWAFCGAICYDKCRNNDLDLERGGEEDEGETQT